MNRTERLRTRLATGELLVVPGCQDALGARMIELAGFEAAYMTGHTLVVDGGVLAVDPWPVPDPD